MKSLVLNQSEIPQKLKGILLECKLSEDLRVVLCFILRKLNSPNTFELIMRRKDIEIQK